MEVTSRAFWNPNVHNPVHNSLSISYPEPHKPSPLPQCVQLWRSYHGCGPRGKPGCQNSGFCEIPCRGFFSKICPDNEDSIEIRRNLSLYNFCIKTNKLHQCIKFILFFGMTLYTFRVVFPSIISSSRLYIQLSNRYCWLLACKQIAVSFWQMSVAVCTVLNCWWWTERPSETCRASFQNKINLIHWCIWLVLL